MVPKLIRIFSLSFSLLLVICTSAQQSMLDEVNYPFLVKLIASAKANYPKVKSYQNRIDAAKLKVRYSKLDWFNIFAFAYFPNNSAAALNPNQANSYQFGFSTSIGTILQKPTNVKLAKKDYEMATLDDSEYSLNIEAIVKQRYYAYVQQLALLNWKAKDLENSESIMKEIKYKFEKGEETFDDYDKSLMMYSNSVQAKISSEGSFFTAKSSLEEIIGVPLESIK